MMQQFLHVTLQQKRVNINEKCVNIVVQFLQHCCKSVSMWMHNSYDIVVETCHNCCKMSATLLQDSCNVAKKNPATMMQKSKNIPATLP